MTLKKAQADHDRLLAKKERLTQELAEVKQQHAAAKLTLKDAKAAEPGAARPKAKAPDPEPEPEPAGVSEGG